VSPEVRRLLESVRIAVPNFQRNQHEARQSNAEMNDQTKEIERLTNDLEASKKLVSSLEATIKAREQTISHHEKHIASQNDLINHLKGEIMRLRGG
jgi:septal ring factor EnvC (AmiA/AmiB activator)